MKSVSNENEVSVQVTPAKPSKPVDENNFHEILCRTVHEASDETNLTSSNKDEVANYMKSYKYAMRNDAGQPTNPLDWWKTNHKDYPNLSKLARKYLAIPATSACSERLFSAAGRTISDERSSLHSDTARNLLYLRYNWDSALVQYPIRRGGLKRDKQKL